MYSNGPLKGLDLIVEERLRQVDPLGYDIKHDAEHHTPEELMAVGRCYIELAEIDLMGQTAEECWGESKPPLWPDTEIPWKPEPSAIENGAKGAAFVAAALDLLFAQVVGEI
jgi:hypothetical protein